MGGYSADPRTRLGLIALLAMRRAKAEKLRRINAAHADTPREAEAVAKAGAKTRRSSCFR